MSRDPVLVGRFRIRLRFLYLNKNAISSISPNAFRGLPRISILELFQNQLTSVPVEALLQLAALTSTYLNHNNIRTISSNVLQLKQNKNLQVQVDNNTLRCDKNLKWFICNLPHLQHISDRYHLTCAAPADLQGTVLTTLMQDVCQDNTGRSHVSIVSTTQVGSLRSPKDYKVSIASSKHDDELPITSPKHDNVAITSPYDKTSPTDEETEFLYTDDVPVYQHTTEILRVVNLGGNPIINTYANSTYVLAMICAVLVPLLLVLASTGFLLTCKRWHGAGQADHDQPTGTDEEEAEGSQNIEPYAVVYSASTELQASANNSPTDSQPAPTQSSADSETIQPYAVAYDEDQEPKSDIQPYAVAYKDDQEQDDSCNIPLYAAGCTNTPHAADGNTDAGSTSLQNITNRQAAMVDQHAVQPENQSPLTDADEEPEHVDEEEENKRSSSNVLYNPAHGQPDSEDITSNVLYNPAHGQPDSEDITSNVLYNPAHGQPDSEDITSNVLYNPAHGQPDSEDITSNVLYNPAHGQPDSEDITSNVLYNPAHGQPDSEDITSNVLYNPAHGQPDSEDITSNVLYNPAHGQPDSEDITSNVLYNPAHGHPER
uniref:LRRCT domain-containing protein n=1 Tax=Branchiostoma floridae TaxID=7739 RepID=C3Z140_BRAFL|eukprot:XP_002597727.1 hypothetical protein BRAFLDRAFT_77369 [Branchiostoma floridae]